MKNGILIFALSFIFISCSKNNFLIKDDKGVVSTPPVVTETQDQVPDEPSEEEGDSSETCSSKLHLYKIVASNQKVSLGEVSCYEDTLSAEQNYNYYSNSSHVLNGPTEKARQSRIFCYENSEGIYLFVSHNKDRAGSLVWNKVLMKFRTSNNDLLDSVVVSDDSRHPLDGELRVNFSDMLNYTREYLGDWSYRRNADGGVIGPFITDNFQIDFKIGNIGDIKEIRFYKADNSFYNLKGLHADHSFTLVNEETCN